MDELRQAQVEKVQEALDIDEIETDKGLNQELGLARAANTHWGSYYKSFKNFINMFLVLLIFLILLLLILNLLKKKLGQQDISELVKRLRLLSYCI